MKSHKNITMFFQTPVKGNVLSTAREQTSTSEYNGYRLLIIFRND